MFRFRLQRVLELREQKEKEEAKVFAEAEHAAASARQELHAASMMNFVSAHTTAPTVGHLNHLDFVLRALDIRLDHSAELVAAAEGVAAAARGSLDAAARDRRVLDRLKEKHQDVHRAEEVRKDRVLMDEVALGRFTRARMITNEGATEE
jgi:flagellar FliJ protein